MTEGTLRALSFDGPSGLELKAVLHQAGKSGPLVVVCHGMLSDMSSPKHVELATLLSNRGISALRFDFPGRGGSGGCLMDMTVALEVEALGCAVEFVRSLGYGPLGLVGSSLGGHVAVQYSALDRDISAVATVNAPARMRDLLNGMEPETWHSQGFIETDGGPVGYSFFEDAWERDLTRSCSESFNAALLVVQAGQDNVVPPAHGMDLAESLSGRLVMLDEADHRLTNPVHRRQVAEMVVDFMAGELVTVRP